MPHDILPFHSALSALVGWFKKGWISSLLPLWSEKRKKRRVGKEEYNEKECLYVDVVEFCIVEGRHKRGIGEVNKRSVGIVRPRSLRDRTGASRHSTWIVHEAEKAKPSPSESQSIINIIGFCPSHYCSFVSVAVCLFLSPLFSSLLLLFFFQGPSRLCHTHTKT
ncbi:hypothetical protein BKA57DRAFT_27616 [Linnemannia elongata]|nr:hypothetical protein BKA57DRAFT_27616 [Linnemannia elongata]